MLVNEYKPEFYVRKVRKMWNLGNVYLRVPLCYEQNGLYIIFKGLTKQFEKFNSNWKNIGIRLVEICCWL